ncbi:MAG: hypothetical protein IKU34_01340 [Clostridia bacterium]|nr:hypothetical protein [Clostridia bacterium]
MSNTIFRQKSLDRISSPEQLDAYIRVSTPSVWLLLLAIVALLCGVCVWGVFGRMDTTLDVVAVARDGVVTAYIRETDAGEVSAGAAVRVNGSEGSVLSLSAQPVAVDAAFTDYMRHAGSLRVGEWVFAATLAVDCADGVYPAQIVTDSVSPMSFVLN